MKVSSIFEAQVVFTPCVQKISFCAKGRPVRMPALPAARATSAASACFSASSSQTVMKLFSSPSYFLMRARKCWVSSRLEYSRAARPAASSARVLSCMAGDYLFDNFRNEIEAGFSGRRNLLVSVAVIAFADHVVAQRLGGVHGVGHGLDTGGVGRLQAVNHAEDVVKAVGDAAFFVSGQFKAGQMGNLGHVGGSQGHGNARGEKL